ncbi:MAG: PqqD family protein [Clostridiales bacterium]|nr:PqqD family protein [Clostridiales bacterium]
MKIKDGYLLRKIQNTAVVVPFGEESVDFNSIMNLNETGAFIWSRIEDDTDEEAVVNAVVGMYDVDRDTAAADVAEFLQLLRNNGLLEE